MSNEIVDYKNQYDEILKKKLEKYKIEESKDASGFERFKLQLQTLCQVVDGVYDKDLKDIIFDNIKLIIVGINPGNEEKNDKKYFSPNSDTGAQIRLFFLMNKNLKYKFNGDAKTDNVLGLNLTPISTAEDSNLKKSDTKVIFSEDCMAEIICELFTNKEIQNKKIQIWFVNQNHLTKRGFQKRYGKIKDQILVFGHPGKRGNFWVDIYNHYKKENKEQFNISRILKTVGENNRTSLEIASKHPIQNLACPLSLS